MTGRRVTQIALVLAALVFTGPRARAATPATDDSADPPEPTPPAATEAAPPPPRPADGPATTTTGESSDAEAPSDAQDASPVPAAPPIAEPGMPTLVEVPPAAYPPEALAAGIEGEVLLDLYIDETGSVIEASIPTPTGHGFDEAALAIAPGIRFTPALDQAGEPVPADIQYVYRFTLQKVAVLVLQVRVRTAGTREPVTQARVVLESADGTRRVVATDEDGVAQLTDMAEGPWKLLATADGSATQEANITITAGQVTEVDVFLTPNRAWEAGRANEELIVEGDRITPEVTERALGADEVRYVPGTAGDIVRAVQSMPGVARPPFNTGQLMVRGTAPGDTGFYLGSSPLPNVFHFGGLSTVINSDSLEEVVFLPGNYGVRYGRTLGGVVDLRTSPDLPTASHGYVSIDLMQSTAFISQPLGGRTGMTVSARRSYIDTVLQPAIKANTATSIQLPRYWDAQARLLHNTKRGGAVDLMLLTSGDRFSVTEADDGSGDTPRTSAYVHRFDRLWLQWRTMPLNGWISEHNLIAGPESSELEYQGDGEAWERTWELAWRTELRRPAEDRGRPGRRFGFDLVTRQQDYLYDVEDLVSLLEYGGDDEGSVRIMAPAVYMEEILRTGAAEFTLGVRADAWIVDLDGSADEESVPYSALSVDPRGALAIDAGARTVLTTTLGGYSQFPTARELTYTSRGNPKLGPERSVQASLGVKHTFTDRVQAELTGWGARLSDLVVGHEDRFEFQVSPPPSDGFDTSAYANDGAGRTYGAEFLTRYTSERTFAWIGVSLSRSLRTDRPGQDEQLYTYDQPVALTAVASHQLPRNWRTGARLRYTSGNPYTPVTNRGFDLQSRSWVPIPDPEQATRLPPWWAIDVRIDKDWPFRKWTLTGYLDLQNATNRRNVELITWTWDYREELPVYGLPIIPAFGLKAAW